MTRQRTTSRLTRRHAGVAALLALTLIVGLMLGDDYGVGADEALNSMVGERSLNAYASLEGYRDYLSTGDILAHHGPAYFMLFTQASRAFTDVLDGWLPSDGRHLANYLTFLVALVCFYTLSRRLLPSRIAAMATAVLASQPVLFGLGFINAKDTPFMALFLAALALGAWAVERPARSRAAGPQGQADTERLAPALRCDWGEARIAGRWMVLAMTGALALLVLDQLFIDGLRELIKSGASWVYQQAPLRGLLSLLAEDIDKTPVEGYFPKLDWLYLAYGRVALLAAATLAWLAVVRRRLPRTSAALLLQPTAGFLPAVLAGAVLGLGLSVRPVAGFAGLLVSGYLIHRWRGRSAGLLLLYWATAGLVAYETWPYLWDAPLASFLGSLSLHTDFTEHEVLYRGLVYPSDALPWHYLPTLFSLQLTEPVIPLLALGVFGLVRSVRRGQVRPQWLIGVGLWLVVPFGATLLPGAGLYNGFRHVLFLVPALLIVFGFGLELILEAVRAPAAQWALFALILAPGVWGTVRLHPYEYAYFNAYAGGMQGSYGEFDQEYWCSSYREAMEFVNQAAPPGATVFFGRSRYAAIPFARPDLILTNQPEDYAKAAFMLYCSRFREDLVWVGGELVYEVGRGPAVFARVYRLDPSPEVEP